MGTGLVTVKLVTGKIGAIAVEKMAILKEIARTVLRISSEGEATQGPRLLVVERAEEGVTARVPIGVTVVHHLQGGMTAVLVTMIGRQEATAKAPGAPRQGSELNTMVHITVGAPAEVKAAGALARNTEGRQMPPFFKGKRIALNWKPGVVICEF